MLKASYKWIYLGIRKGFFSILSAIISGYEALVVALK